MSRGLEDADASVRLGFSRALLSIEANNAAATRVVVRSLVDEDPHVRAQAVRVLWGLRSCP